MKLETRVRLKAMDLLARREHSYVELYKKLIQRDFEPSIIEPVLEKLQQDNLLSDERFTEAYVRYRSGQGFGPLRIKQELQQKGVSEYLISNYLYQEINWPAQLAQVWQKKFSGQLPGDAQTRSKQIRFLQYRGFELHEINLLLR